MVHTLDASVTTWRVVVEQAEQRRIMSIFSTIVSDKIAKTLLMTMTKQIQADKILSDVVEISTLDLYFRPIYAFEFTWKTKSKTGIAEFDAATGNMIAGKVARGKSDQPITKEGLFDINDETATSLVPTTAGNVKLIRA